MSKSYRGPELGYSSDVKQNYRESVWSAIGPMVKENLKADARLQVLILPSAGGEEIDVAVSHGIPEDRIIAVDENPALIASARWRKSRPLVKCYGSSLSRAAERIKSDGYILSAANLDLCNNFSEDLVSEVSGFFSSAKISREFCFSITVMKGRENKATNMLLNHVFSNSPRGFDKIHDKRIRALCTVMDDFQSSPMSMPTSVIAQGSYVHSKTPMAWCAFASGFVSELRALAKSIKVECDNFQELEQEFLSKRPIRLDGADRAWPEREEQECIAQTKKTIDAVLKYDKMLHSADFIEPNVWGVDRFFIECYGQDILRVIGHKNFHNWWLGKSQI